MSPITNERTVAAWVDQRTAPCFHHALLLQRAEPRTWDDPAADPILQSVLTALDHLRLDDEARQLGLHRDAIAAIRFALAALLDECAAHQPGSERWREHLFDRAGLPRSANVGHEFFVALERRLAQPTPAPADLAVLHVHAICLSLGLRGRYGAHVEAAESELQHQVRRLHLKLRPLLTPRLPPTAAAPPLDLPPSSSRATLFLKISALLLVFALAFVASLRNDTHQQAERLQTTLTTH